MNSFAFIATAAVLAVAPWMTKAVAQEDAVQKPARLELGANVNESLTYLDAKLLDRSRTTWVRGFLPASQFIRGKRDLATDPGVQTLQHCAQDGRKVMLTIKWDFREAGLRAPAPESLDERQCFAFVDSTLARLRGRLSAFALVNEVFIDTPAPDMRPDAAGHIPMVDFLRRLSDHVAAGRPKDPREAPLPVFGGGFTRLDTDRMQTNAATLALLRWLNTDTNIAGATFHLHQDNFAQYEKALNFIHQRIPAKPLAVTEFSLIWNYQAHLEDPIDAGDAGRAFAQEHHLARGTTVREFINQCLARPVSEAVWTQFLQSQSWIDANFLKHSCDLMESHGVVLATYAFSQKSSGGHFNLRPGGTPWLLNPIYIPLVAVGPDTNQTAVNRLWFDEYLQRQNRLVSKSLQQ